MFKKLTGIIGSAFKLGFTGNQIKNHTDGISIRDTTDANYKNILVARPQGSDKDIHASTFADVKERVILLEWSFDGGTAPTPGDNTGKYGLCHTSGGSYNAGEIWYDNGTSVTQVTVFKMLMVTAALAISGTVSMIADGVYQAETGSAPYTWTLKGDGSGSSTGQEQVIGISVTATAGNFDSTTSIPDGAVVTKVTTCVDTLYDGSATIAVSANGSSPVTLQATSENAPGIANIYQNDPFSAIGATGTGVARVVLGGSPTVGAARVYVHYVTPLA